MIHCFNCCIILQALDLEVDLNAARASEDSEEWGFPSSVLVHMQMSLFLPCLIMTIVFVKVDMKLCCVFSHDNILQCWNPLFLWSQVLAISYSWLLNSCCIAPLCNRFCYIPWVLVVLGLFFEWCWCLFWYSCFMIQIISWNPNKRWSMEVIL